MFGSITGPLRPNRFREVRFRRDIIAGVWRPDGQFTGDQHLRSELLVCTSFEVHACVNRVPPRPACRRKSAFNRSVYAR